MSNEQLIAALGRLDHDADYHWTQVGLPALNVLSEFMGSNVSRKMLAEAGLGDVKRRALEGGGDEGSVDRSAPPNEAVAEVKEMTRAESGAAEIISAMDELNNDTSPEVWQRHPELHAVFQLFQAERPTILGRQERLAIRRGALAAK